ncbi:MAG: DUF1858 domain-containing protein [Eubacteriaceae bacterium]|jgi:hybrid cluster-associated redox disulfide protein|nr:DUF1858 domain-containing protein [Eubacteriaceae bacterium]
MAEKINRKMSIVEIVQTYPDTVPVFQNYGMGCLGCVAAQFETLEEGCLVHGIDPDELVRALNAVTA